MEPYQKQNEAYIKIVESESENYEKAIELLKKIYKEDMENGEISFKTSYEITQFLMNIHL